MSETVICFGVFFSDTNTVQVKKLPAVLTKVIIKHKPRTRAFLRLTNDGLLN